MRCGVKAQSSGHRPQALTNFHRKAQASIEFMNIVSMMLIILLGLLAISAMQSRATHDTGLKITMKHQCNELATAINTVYNGGSGFTAHIELPQAIAGGHDYGMAINQKTIAVTAENNVAFCRILTSNVSYTTINKGLINLTNANGTVYIS